MLEVFANITIDYVSKSVELIQAFTKKGFDFLLSDGDVGFIFYLLLVLMTAKQGIILKENGGNNTRFRPLTPAIAK